MLFLTSCGNSGKKESTEAQNGALKVEFASLASNPDEFIGKNVVVEGKVVHVCMESGKKLFITGENPDIMLYIQAGENMPKFPLDLLGSTVSVEGVITKPLAAATPTENSEGMHEVAGTDSCSTESALAGQTSLADIMMEYKSHSVK